MATTTLDPSNTAATVTLSGGNLVMSETTGAGNSRSVANKSSGKFYCEMNVTSGTNSYDHGLGVGNSSTPLTSAIGTTTDSVALFSTDANIYFNNTTTGVTVGVYNSPDVVGMAVDLTNLRVWFRINGGNWNGSPTNDPASNVGGLDISAITGPFYVFGNVGVNGGSVETFNFGATTYANAAPSGFGNWTDASSVVTGWDYIQDDIYPRRVFSLSAAPAFAPKPFATTNTNAGIPWFKPREIDKLAKGAFLTDPVAIAYIPQITTWSFLVGDTILLRDPPVDSPPAFERPITVAVNTNAGIPWFEPPDRDRPPTKVRVESLPAAFVSTFKTAPISGMAWFTPLDWSKSKVSYSQSPAYNPIPPFGVSVSGMAWFTPPDRDKVATKVRIESPPSITLTPSTLPTPIRGMAWFEPPDLDRPATKIKFDYPPAFVRFPVGNITLTLSSTESPDLASFAASFRALWVAANKQDETWTPATLPAGNWVN